MSGLDRLIDEACGVTEADWCYCGWLKVRETGRCANPEHRQPGDYLEVRHGRGGSRLVYVTEGGVNSVLGYAYVASRRQWATRVTRFWAITHIRRRDDGYHVRHPSDPRTPPPNAAVKPPAGREP